MAVLLSALIALTGCVDQAGGGGANDSIIVKDVEFPPKEKVTLKVMVRGVTNVEDYATNSFTKWYEEKTNVHIDWEVIPATNAQDKLNLVLASNNYPDVIFSFGITPTTQMIYGSQGVFVPLNKYIDKYGSETKRLMKEIPELKDAMTAPDGNIYGLPYVNQCFQCSFPQRMWIYKPWLDKLGLKVPTTTDDLYNVLKAFKTRDPNGNSKADEIPMMGSITSTAESFLMNSFIFNQNPNHLLMNKGKVEAAFTQPEWKDGLAYMNKLYSEGLLSKQTFTQDDKQLKEVAENPNTPIVGVIPAFGVNTFTQIGGASGRWLDYVAVPPLKGPKGVQIGAINPNNFTNANFVITSSSKNPEIAFRWADGLYNEDVSMRSVTGEPGKQWRKVGPDDKGLVGLDGRKAEWVELQPYGNLQNDGWNQTGNAHYSDNIRLGKASDPKTPNLAWILYKASKELYAPHQPPEKEVVPPLFFSNDQAMEMAPMQKTINDYVTESIARFVTGDLKIDKDWNAYLKNLDGMNVKRYLEINQAAYDAKYKK
jgi:putative aldouronate transport system substrate-binding protein